MINQIVYPTIVDGIEFYVAPNGESGMSVSGLARLCGQPRTTIQGRLAKIRCREKQESRAETHENTGNSAADSGAFLDVRAAQNAKVVKDDVCAEIVEHYAFDSQFESETALFSYRKFAKMGIRSWIHQVTGYAQAHDLNKLAEAMSELLHEVKELRVETREYKTIRSKGDSEFPGLNELMDDLATDGDVKALPGGDTDGRFTASEWLETKGVTLDKSQLHKFSSLASFTYRTITKKNPVVVYRHSTQRSKNKKVNGYLVSEFPILSIAFTKLMADLASS